MAKMRILCNAAISLLVILVLLISASFARANTLAVHFIDVGQGDAIFVQSPEGKTMLIDAGERNGMAERYLELLGVQSIDIVVATHPHLDHIGGLPAILQKYDVKKIIMPRVTGVTTLIYQQLLETIRSRDMRVTEGRAGMVIDFGSVAVECLAPNSAEYRDINDHSIVLRLTYGDVSFLLTGDATRVSENEMLSAHRDRLQSNVLKIGHHGSTTSTTLPFLNAVNPHIVVFTVGKNNRYGHPTQMVWDRVSHLDIFRTDVQGTIILATDGRQIFAYGAPVNGQFPVMTPYQGSRITAPVQSVADNARIIEQLPTPTVTRPAIVQPAVSQHTAPAAQPQAATPAPATQDIVYITNTGRMYHRDGCRSLSRSQIPISRVAAIQRGLTACSICNP